jgi:hypothetical protein
MMDHDIYQRAESHLSTTITLPRFDDAATAIARILAHRTEIAGVVMSSTMSSTPRRLPGSNGTTTPARARACATSSRSPTERCSTVLGPRTAGHQAAHPPCARGLALELSAAGQTSGRTRFPRLGCAVVRESLHLHTPLR